MTDDAFRAARHRPSDRYGERPSSSARRWAVRVVVAVIAAVAVGWWVTVALSRSTPAVAYELIGFERPSDTSVEVRFRIQRDAGLSVSCTLWARDISGAEVGRDNVVIPASEGREVERTESMRTTDRAVSADVIACTPINTEELPSPR